MMVLASQSRWKISVERDRSKQSEVYRRTGLRIQKPVEGIRRDGTILAKKRRIEEHITDVRRPAEDDSHELESLWSASQLAMGRRMEKDVPFPTSLWNVRVPL